MTFLLGAMLGQVLMLVGSPPASSSDDLTVQTTSGPIRGLVADGAKQWRGVAFAAPPVADLRWRPPQQVAPWTATRDASGFREPCAQPDFNTGGLLGSEDCLYLNVSAPAGSIHQDKLPVMVHLHGGSNSRGWPMQDTSPFTDRGVIVVTVAYRLGSFGFVGHPALSAEAGGTSGEYGVLDQIAALKWVRDNIARFGGDPTNVTLFGLSAGSFDTVALMASPLSRGLMARAAVQGEVWWAFNGKFNTIAEAEQIGVDLATRVGCQTAADVTACMRRVPAEQLAEFLDAAPWVGGTVLPRSPEALLREQGGVPLLVGFDREEDSIFNYPFPENYPRGRWASDINLVLGATNGLKARELYPPEAYDSLWWSYVTLLTDAVRGCPTRRLANIVSGQAPVWRFLYTHTLADPFYEQFRAAHSLEDILLWHYAADVGVELTRTEQHLANQMNDYWTNFAKTGDPNGTGLPTWPRYDTATEPTLGLDTSTRIHMRYHQTECAFQDTVPILFPYPWEFGAKPPTLPLFPPGFE